jgi:hypothetical protein
MDEHGNDPVVEKRSGERGKYVSKSTYVPRRAHKSTQKHLTCCMIAMSLVSPFFQNIMWDA